MRYQCSLVRGILVAGTLSLPVGGVSQVAEAPERPRAVYDDYREGAGQMENGVLRLRLTAREVTWYPRGEDSGELTAYAFAAADGPAQVPGPMIRVTAGTPVEVTVMNGLDRTLVLRGLNDRATADTVEPPDELPFLRPFVEGTLRLEPGEEQTVRFTPTRAGAFFYYARTLPLYAPEPDPPLASFVVLPEELFAGDGPDGPFLGPLIVDPPGADPPSDEQIILITRWGHPVLDRMSWSQSWKMMLNGRSWPATERLEYTVGDTVRWRVINASLQSHPMHLHGFYFRVDARGDPMGETTFAPEDRVLAVTEFLGGLGATVRITWVPETPGNWLFHCHLVRHMSAIQRLAGEPRPGAHGEGIGDHAYDGMAGMVMGITVRPRPGQVEPPERVARRLHLYAGQRDGMVGDDPGYGFVLQEGEDAPAPDSVLIPGSPLVLTRGEMTEVVVHNRLGFPFGVHWHGLELASRYDGVADWSGEAGRTVPPIAPGDSFAVRIAPPRAGTFMYHVHSEPGHELSQGMYGPFLVLEPGETFDPERDRIFVLGSSGTEINAQDPVVNGVVEPTPLEFRAGETYRLRFIHISADDVKSIRLVHGDKVETWRAVARDGADLPVSLATTGPAEVSVLGVGETRDYLWTPSGPGRRTLTIQTTHYGASGRPPSQVEIAVEVVAG